jgi:hypothetical protein
MSEAELTSKSDISPDEWDVTICGRAAALFALSQRKMSSKIIQLGAIRTEHDLTSLGRDTESTGLLFARCVIAQIVGFPKESA